MRRRPWKRNSTVFTTTASSSAVSPRAPREGWGAWPEWGAPCWLWPPSERVWALSPRGERLLQAEAASAARSREPCRLGLPTSPPALSPAPRGNHGTRLLCLQPRSVLMAWGLAGAPSHPSRGCLSSTPSFLCGHSPADGAGRASEPDSVRIENPAEL